MNRYVRPALPFLVGALASLLPSTAVLAETATKHGVTITIPEKWALNPKMSSQGPLAIDNFSSAYVKGGLVPFGKAAIDITRKPLPAGTLDEIVDAERKFTLYFTKTTQTVGGSPAILVTYGAENWPDYEESDVAVYVARGFYLYILYLTYNTQDTGGQASHLSAFNSVLNSVQFAQ